MSQSNLGTLDRTGSPSPGTPSPSTSSPSTSTVGLSIGEYLIRRLQDYGIQDVFGIPGDYILSFYSMLDASPINVVGCTREDCAGFAADAYARVQRDGGRVRDVLRRRAELVQFDRRGLCREIAGGR